MYLQKPVLLSRHSGGIDTSWCLPHSPLALFPDTMSCIQGAEGSCCQICIQRNMHRGNPWLCNPQDGKYHHWLHWVHFTALQNPTERLTDIIPMAGLGRGNGGEAQNSQRAGDGRHGFHMLVLSWESIFAAQKPQVPSLAHQCNIRDCCYVCNCNTRQDTLARGATNWKFFSWFCYRQREMKWVIHAEPILFLELAMKCKVFATAGILPTTDRRILDVHTSVLPQRYLDSGQVGRAEKKGKGRERERERKRDSWRSTIGEHCSKSKQQRKNNGCHYKLTLSHPTLVHRIH